MKLHSDQERVSEDVSTYRIRNKESFAYARECQRSWGHLNEVLDWCKSELIEDWRWQLVDMSTDTRPGRYIFYFDSERDCLAFTLKWG